MQKTTVKKYLLDGSLIVFSVLFALFINKMVDDQKTKARKELVLDGIRKELSTNAAILADWDVRHSAILTRITQLVDGQADTLKQQLLVGKHFDLGVLTNEQSLMDAPLTSTAWKTAQSTSLIEEFDYGTVLQLTRVYSLQDIMIDKTMDKILDLYFDPDTHDLSHVDQTLIQFQLRFSELIGQEYLLGVFYKDTLEKLEE